MSLRHRNRTCSRWIMPRSIPAPSVVHGNGSKASRITNASPGGIGTARHHRRCWHSSSTQDDHRPLPARDTIARCRCLPPSYRDPVSKRSPRRPRMAPTPLGDWRADVVPDRASLRRTAALLFLSLQSFYCSSAFTPPGFFYHTFRTPSDGEPRIFPGTF